MQQKTRHLKLNRNKHILAAIKPYLFLVPVFVLILTFKYIPFLNAIIKSFFKWNGGNVDEFIGFQNYTSLFQSKQFYISLLNSLKFCLANVVIALTLPLLAAELLFAVKSRKMQYLVRTLLTFPMVVPGMVVILLWKWILSGDSGLLNDLLTKVGLTQLVNPWLGSSKTALFAVILVGFPWISGLQFLLYYGALQSIPSMLFEAAKIDGANTFQRFFKVDLPMLASQFKLIITLAIISGMQVFETVFILTHGGPGSTTLVPSILIYSSAFDYKRFGYSSAVGVVMFLIIMIISVINQKFLKNTETGE